MYQMRVSSEELRSLPPRPPSFIAASTKRRFVKLGRKTSDGSQQSASSTGSSPTGRSAEGVAVRQSSKSRIHRHANRLSGVFRGPASSSRSSLSIQSRKASMISADAFVADDPSELSNQITAPGILKIFGNEICEGAHYKSVLATTHSSAKELVKEALERYGLNKEQAASYVLCDTIGSTGGQQWKTEGFRVVGDHEKPLLLQALWKPREGLARRFEIQRRSSVEEKTSRDKDTVTAGINAQARKLQKSRSRVTSTLIERTMGRGHKLWRSRSEMDLLDSDAETKLGPARDKRSESLSPTTLQRPEQPRIQSPAAPPGEDGGPRAKTETLCPSRPKDEGEGEESEREETESSDDNSTQFSIHPPHDCPYLLLLQGCSPAQDFILYLLAAPDVVIGRRGRREDEPEADILLCAADVLPRHCGLCRRGAGGATTLCPYGAGAVTRNGEALTAGVRLSPGDVIGLGRHYLFLFKDPLAPAPNEVGCAAPERGMLARSSTSAPGDESTGGAPPLLKSPDGRGLTLSYGADHEGRVVQEIVAMGGGGSDGRPPLTPAFLLCACLQYSSSRRHTAALRRLLLLLARGVQRAVWESTKDLAAAQPDVLGGGGSSPEVIPGLRPLVVWMSNSLELLQFVQYQLPLVLEWRSRTERGDESRDMEDSAVLELHLSRVRSASEETTAVLEEVIMLAFQQCVYYITKVLYPILPGLLDCNPFRESPDPQASGESRGLGSGGPQVPAEIRQIVEVLAETWRLLSDCQLHPDISSQLIGYLFYFINASLFNSLVERGSEPGFYQWSRGVRVRANLDLLLDWAHAAGLGELALEHTHALSSAINLLATPRKNLLQTPWVSLRADYPALNPAQLNHLLSLYSPASPHRHTWTPSAQDRAAAHQTADILENFDTHHPLVLPDEGYQFLLTRPVTVPALREQLDRLREFISTLYSDVTVAGKHQSGSVPVEAKLTKADVLPTASLKMLDPSPAEMVLSHPAVQNEPSTSSTSPAPPPPPPSPPSPPSTLPSHCQDELGSGGVLLLSQKLRSLELQTRDMKPSAPDPSCLLTPPNTPHIIEPGDSADSEAPPRSSGVDAHDEGGLVFECLAALKVEHLKTGCHSMNRIVELQEEEDEREGKEEDEEEEEEDHYDDSYDEVFCLELERGERGLGLALVDTKDTPFTVKGIFIRAVLPDSPAARCEKLVPGDRILAVNGVSLLGLDYQGGRELIQSSGDTLRLLVARSDWMAKAIQAEC